MELEELEEPEEMDKVGELEELEELKRASADQINEQECHNVKRLNDAPCKSNAWSSYLKYKFIIFILF